MDGGTDWQRGPAGDDNGRQGHQGQHQPTDEGRRTRQAEKIEKNGQAQQPEDDGRDGGQVVDVDLDQIGPSVLGGKLLQVNGSGHAGRKREQQGDDQGIEAAHQGPTDPRQFRFAGVPIVEESDIEGLAHPAVCGQLIDPGHFFVLQPALALRQAPVHVPFDEHVHVVVGGHPDRNARSDQAAILQQHVAHLERRAGAHQPIEGTFVLSPRHVGKQLAQ